MVASMIVAISLVVGASTKLAYASTTFTVNSTGNATDAVVGDDVCETSTSGECTLRAAIQEVNATTDPDTINFNVSGTGCVAGVCTISPASELPIITQPVMINGYTQGDGTPADPSDDATENTLAVGDNAKLKIRLDGTEAGNGLKIEADNSTVKGLVVSNWENGVFLGVDATGNAVRGNFIGTDASGSNLSNNIGVALTNAPNNTIGGTTAAARNIISGNGTWGVLISDPDAIGNTVQGNFIGTDVTGTVNDPDGIPTSGDELGNGLNGVSIRTGADNNTIGGTTAGAGNIISGNGYNGSDLNDAKSGVEVQFVNGDLPTGNRILSNSIYDNVKLGIDLYFTNDPPGVTDNDAAPLDTDSGPNHLQNFPEITSARRTTRVIQGHRRRVTVIRGTLNSEATKTYNVQFFSSPTADASGHGEGKRFLGGKSVTTNGSGDASFIFITRKRVPRGQVVAATATNQSTGDTSEFSLAKTVS
jgi:hypothetical protein